MRGFGLAVLLSFATAFLSTQRTQAEVSCKLAQPENGSALALAARKDSRPKQTDKVSARTYYVPFARSTKLSPLNEPVYWNALGLDGKEVYLTLADKTTRPVRYSMRTDLGYFLIDIPSGAKDFALRFPDTPDCIAVDPRLDIVRLRVRETSSTLLGLFENQARSGIAVATLGGKIFRRNETQLRAAALIGLRSDKKKEFQHALRLLDRTTLSIPEVRTFLNQTMSTLSKDRLERLAQHIVQFPYSSFSELHDALLENGYPPKRYKSLTGANIAALIKASVGSKNFGEFFFHALRMHRAGNQGFQDRDLDLVFASPLRTQEADQLWRAATCRLRKKDLEAFPWNPKDTRKTDHALAFLRALRLCRKPARLDWKRLLSAPLASKTWMVRYEALRSLAVLDPMALDEAARALQNDPYPRVRAVAWQTETSIDRVRTLLANESWPMVRAAAISGLKESILESNQEAVVLASTAIEDKSPQVRAAAIQVLGSLPNPSKDLRLKIGKRLMDKQEEDAVRFKALSYFQERCDIDALVLFERLIKRGAKKGSVESQLGRAAFSAAWALPSKQADAFRKRMLSAGHSDPGIPRCSTSGGN